MEVNESNVLLPRSAVTWLVNLRYCAAPCATPCGLVSSWPRITSCALETTGECVHYDVSDISPLPDLLTKQFTGGFLQNTPLNDCIQIESLRGDNNIANQ